MTCSGRNETEMIRMLVSGMSNGTSTTEMRRKGSRACKAELALRHDVRPAVLNLQQIGKQLMHSSLLACVCANTLAEYFVRRFKQRRASTLHLLQCGASLRLKHLQYFMVPAGINMSVLSLSVHAALAPTLSKARTIAILPARAATCNTVYPASSRLFTLAPQLSSANTASLLPAFAATRHALRLQSSTLFSDAPFASSSCTCSLLFEVAASRSRNDDASLFLSGSAPCLRGVSAAWRLLFCTASSSFGTPLCDSAFCASAFQLSLSF